MGQFLPPITVKIIVIQPLQERALQIPNVATNVIIIPEPYLLQ